MASMSEPLLRIEGLRTHFHTQDGVVRSVDGVDLDVSSGSTLCLVGESGCGKSVTARSILNIVDPPGRIVEGRIWWRSEERPVAQDQRKRGPRRSHTPAADRIDLASLPQNSEALRSIRGNEIAMVFQEPMASLSPMYTVGQHLVEAIQLHRRTTLRAARAEAIELLERVGIPSPRERLDVYPFQLSGGMCQRVMIAMALSCSPRLLIADEPTTALDVTNQARILDLLIDIQRSTGMAMLFITHDLGVVAEIADEVAVMYRGRVVERGPVHDIFHRPQHPYTQVLLAALPQMGAGRRRRLTAAGGQGPKPPDPSPQDTIDQQREGAVRGTPEVADRGLEQSSLGAGLRADSEPGEVARAGSSE